MVIGRKFDSETLGVYNRGENFPKFIGTNVSGVLQNVIFPTLTYYTGDKATSLAIIRRSLTLGIYCVMPCMFGLAAAAEPMIRVLLTDKWLDCVFFLRLACVVYAFNPVLDATSSALYALGKSGTVLKLVFFRYSHIVLVLLVTSNFGLQAMAVGYMLVNVFCNFFYFVPLRKFFPNYKPKMIIVDILPSILISGFMFMVVYSLSFIRLSYLVIFILQVFVGIVVYIFFSLITKHKSFIYLVDIFKVFIAKRRNLNV